jgi:hypothetical protein
VHQARDSGCSCTRARDHLRRPELADQSMRRPTPLSRRPDDQPQLKLVVAGFDVSISGRICGVHRGTRNPKPLMDDLEFRVLRFRWWVASSVIGLRNAVVSRMKLELERRLSPPSPEAAIDRSRTRSRSGGGACHTQESRAVRHDHSLRGSTNTRA